MGVKRPRGYVEVDEYGKEIREFGKGVEDHIEEIRKSKEITKDVEDDLANFFGEDVVSQFGKDDNLDLPRNVNGEIIDNKKITITTVKKPQ